MELSSPPNVICFGEILWDILPSGPQPGGAPMNVGYHLKKLGQEPALLTRIGLDNYGEKLVSMLSDSGITTEYLQVDHEHPTGLVYANLDNSHEVSYDIVFPSAWDFIQSDDDFGALLADAEFFVYGSLTSRNKESRDTLYQLLESAKTKVLDINIRSPHFNRPRLEYLLQKADILKMNEGELELITGWFTPFNAIEDRIKLLQDHFEIATAIVTLGGDGAIVSDRSNVYKHPGFKVQVADTIGSGDAFLAGFISQLLNGSTPENALPFASTIGAFIASRSGACPDYTIVDINQFINSDHHKKSLSIL
jgi:fructokinase